MLFLSLSHTDALRVGLAHAEGAELEVIYFDVRECR